MSAARRNPKRSEAHVRFYAHELRCEAWRSLSTDAKSLLIEMRAFYSGGENRVHFSVRQIVDRLGVGQRRATAARDQLLDRGWIRLIEKGAFTRKNRLASVYALTHEPLTDADGAVAPKDYMRWQPPEKLLTVAATTTDSSCNDYRDPQPIPGKYPDSSRSGCRQSTFQPSTVAVTATQISYQRERSERAVVLWALLEANLTGADAFKLCLAYVALHHGDQFVERLAA